MTHAALPDLQMAMESPPFRALTTQEDAAAVDRINASGAGFVFVGLGWPKQERWMASHRSSINAVMIGVGAAFDFHAGTVQRAPAWMRDNGLEAASAGVGTRTVVEALSCDEYAVCTWRDAAVTGEVRRNPSYKCSSLAIPCRRKLGMLTSSF